MTEKAKTQTKPTAPPARPAPASAVAVRSPEKDDALVADLLSAETNPQHRAKLFELADAVAQSRLLRKAAALVGVTQWGAGLSQEGRVAFGRYCLEVGADPLRHVDLLGGNPFFNSDYYRDMIAANPEFEGDDPPAWIHDDPRLAADEKDETLPEEVRDAARKERLYRRAQRIARNVDDADPAACVLRLRYKGGRVFEGVGTVHFGKVKNSRDPAARDRDRDPIGLENPRTTAESRAWREAGEKAEPIWFRNHPRVKALEGKLVELHDAGELRAAPSAPELPPAPIQAEEGSIEEIREPGEPQQVEVGTEDAGAEENHNPTALCPIEGPHARSACGYHRKNNGIV
jgi:hypothetical protein